MNRNRKTSGRISTPTKSGLLVMLFSAASLVWVSAPFMTATAQSTSRDKIIQALGVNRRVHVTAASVDAVQAGKRYEIDLRSKRVVYDLNPEPRAIPYSRVMVRTALGVTPIASYLKRKLPQVDLRGWESKRVLLVALAGKNSRGNLAIKGGESGFSCGSYVCSCTGDDDCNDMFTTNVCGDFAFCDAETDKCYCSRD